MGTTEAPEFLSNFEELRLFIISHSTSPKKRFSLRLSILLMNGVIKIFREQAIILQDELFSVLSTINIPVGLGSIAALERSGIFETPPTPIPKVKRRKGRKTVVANTPEINLPSNVAEDIFIQLPNFEDILRPPARTEDISIRDEVYRRPELQQEDFGLGVLTTKEVEEEMLLLRSKTPEVPTIHLPYPSSESLPPQGLIEVVAQVHVPRDGIIDEDEQLQTPIITAERLNTENVELTQHILKSSDTQNKRPIEQISSTIVEISPITEIREAVQDERSLEHISTTVQEEQVITENRETQIAHKKTRCDQIPLVEVQSLDKTQPKTKQSQTNERLFLTRPRNTFVRINRCIENEGQFIDESCQLPAPFKNIVSVNLYDLFWYEENIEHNVQIRGASMRSLSVGDSVGLHRTDTPSAQRSTLDTQLSLEIASRHSVLPLDPQVQESTPIGTVKHVSIEEPPVPLHTPRKRKRTTISGIEAISQQTVPEEIAIAEPATVSENVITEHLVVSEPTAISKQLQSQEEIEVQEQLLSEVIDTKEKQRASPILPDYKLRQQKIVDLVAQWNSVQGILTIEDVCEKPVNRFNIAVAFSDLLTLAANKFLILKSDENSLELKSIEKGLKLLKR